MAASATSYDGNGTLRSFLVEKYALFRRETDRSYLWMSPLNIHYFKVTPWNSRLGVHSLLTGYQHGFA